MMVLFMLISALLGGFGQLLFKYAFQDGSFSLTILGGLAVYAISTMFYFYVLSRAHLSWSNAISGVSYVLAVALATVVLHEYVSPLRWAGVLVITVGVVFVSIS